MPSSQDPRSTPLAPIPSLGALNLDKVITRENAKDYAHRGVLPTDALVQLYGEAPTDPTFERLAKSLVEDAPQLLANARPTDAHSPLFILGQRVGQARVMADLDEHATVHLTNRALEAVRPDGRVDVEQKLEFMKGFVGVGHVTQALADTLGQRLSGQDVLLAGLKASPRRTARP